MNDISVYIVDDESLARERLKRLIDSFDNCILAGEAENGIEALAAIPKVNPDIVLLDIRMPGEDGLAVAEKLTRLPQAPAIIFCTAYDDYAISAFKYNAMGYLLKPVRPEDLLHVLNNAKKINQLQLKNIQQQIADQHELQRHEQMFVAHTWQGHELISLDNIYFFKSDHKYLTAVHTGGETLSDQTLKDLEQTYPDLLLRAHRNTLINKNHISALVKNKSGQYEIKFKNYSHCVTVSRRHVGDIKNFLASL